MNNDQSDIHHLKSPHYYTVIFFEKPYGLYTYQYNSSIELYCFVKVSFGRTMRTGLVWADTTHPKTNYEIKSIIEILAKPCFNTKMIDFLKFAQNYYKSPLQEVLHTALSSKMRQLWIDLSDRELSTNHAQASFEPEKTGLVLSEEQLNIVNRLKQPGFSKNLIFGVTGSGKTRCYLEAARYWVEHGNVLYLVPEIHLSHQVIMQIEKTFSSKVVVYHSQMTPKKRWEAFLEASQSERRVIFVTTRSGIFLPFQNIKMIIIDEEHDPSYKQQEGAFRYNARDLALYLARQHNCVCVLGSATPTPKFLDPILGGMQVFELHSRATGFPLPNIEIYSTTIPTMLEPLNWAVLKEIRDVLQKGEQALIYLNQRGYAPRLYCQPCKSFASCPQCLTPVVYHHDLEQGVCHHCGWVQQYRYLKKCSTCKEEREPLGFGTERLAEFLQDIFPGITQHRFDTDCIRTVKQMKTILNDLQRPGPALIIGTQMISKGHDWPNVTLAILLVGAFQIKEQLHPALVQQVLQTAGRSGRHAPGRVIMPITHDQIGMKALDAFNHDKYPQYIQHYQESHPETKMHAAKIFFHGVELEQLLKELRQLTTCFKGCEGPLMDYPPKRGRLWRVFILVLSTTRLERHEIVDLLLKRVCGSTVLSKAMLSVEIDPLLLY